LINAEGTNVARVSNLAVTLTTLEEAAVVEANFVAIVILCAEADKAAVEVKTVGRADCVIFARTLRIDFTASEKLKTVKVFTQNDVTNTGNSVRTLNRRRAVKQQVVTVNQRTWKQVNRCTRWNALHTSGGKTATVNQ
jgi:hypothetical protein